jgi:hypothetical protein
MHFFPIFRVRPCFFPENLLKQQVPNDLRKSSLILAYSVVDLDCFVTDPDLTPLVHSWMDQDPTLKQGQVNKTNFLNVQKSSLSKNLTIKHKLYKLFMSKRPDPASDPYAASQLAYLFLLLKIKILFIL